MVNLSKLVTYASRAPEVITAWRQTSAFPNLLLRYLEVGRPTYPVSIRLTGGEVLSLGSPEEVKIFWQIFVRQCYQIPVNCRTIIDAGANVGMFVLWALRQQPAAKIVAIEPFPETVQTLRENIRVNGLDGRVTVMELGLAGQSGERSMRTQTESPHRGLVLQSSTETAFDTVPVRCLTLEEVLEATDLKTIDLLKMDIEGSEWEVLFATPKSVLRRIRHIMLEYHEVDAAFGYSPEKLFAHLASAGHTLTRREEDPWKTGLAYFSQ